jgi:hypothetical protein
MTGPLVEGIRALSRDGLEILDLQVGTLAYAFRQRLKPAERRKLCAARDSLTRRLALWRDLLSDESALVTRLDALAEQMVLAWPRMLCEPARTAAGPPCDAEYGGVLGATDPRSSAPKP